MSDDTKSPGAAPDKLRIRVTAAEKARLQGEAAAAGISLAELIRRRVLGKPVPRGLEVAQLSALRALAQAILDRRVGTESDVVLQHIEADMLRIEVESLGAAEAGK
ncbi:hypothetical protein [Dolichospermum phage Dfl-JY14]